MAAPARKSVGTTKQPNRPPISSLTIPIGCLTEEKRKEEKRSKKIRREKRVQGEKRGKETFFGGTAARLTLLCTYLQKQVSFWMHFRTKLSAPPQKNAYALFVCNVSTLDTPAPAGCLEGNKSRLRCDQHPKRQAVKRLRHADLPPSV